MSAESMATCFADAPFNLDILTTIRAEPGNDDDRILSTGCKRVVFAAFGHRDPSGTAREPTTVTRAEPNNAAKKTSKFASPQSVVGEKM